MLTPTCWAAACTRAGVHWQHRWPETRAPVSHSCTRRSQCCTAPGSSCPPHTMPGRRPDLAVVLMPAGPAWESHQQRKPARPLGTAGCVKAHTPQHRWPPGRVWCCCLATRGRDHRQGGRRGHAGRPGTLSAPRVAGYHGGICCRRSLGQQACHSQQRTLQQAGRARQGVVGEAAAGAENR